MSLRLGLLNLGLRLIEKPYLARIRDAGEARAALEAAAERWFVDPPGAAWFEVTLGGRPAIEAVAGRPDRRRVLLWFHGGAYVQGSARTHRRLGAALSAASGCRVILPDYRLAPEDPFPAAPEDALACWRDLLAGHDPARIAIGGDSAGGGLAFALLHMIGAAGLPGPAGVVAFSPWTDLTLSQPSLRENARADPFLPAARLAEIRDAYLGGADPADPRASPVFGSFRRPPPVLIQAGRREILADDAEAMALALRAAGGAAQLRWWQATPHAWQVFHGRLAEADAAIAEAGAFLAELLSRPRRCETRARSRARSWAGSWAGTD